VLPAGLLMVQLHLIDDGTPVLYSHDYYRGDRFSFEVLRRVEAKA
jgi:DNA-binding GntR family transcriptional regulator